MINIIKMLIIISVFVGICLWCILGSKNRLRNQVLKKSMGMPEYIKDELKKKETENAGMVYTYSKERVKHCIRSVVIGVIVYLVAFFGGMLKMKIEHMTMDNTDYLISSIPWGAVIFILVIIDILKVAPWKMVCVIKGVISMDSVMTGNETFVFYYDFVKGDFAVDNLSDTRLVSDKDKTVDGFLKVLAQIRNNRLKIIDIVK